MREETSTMLWITFFFILGVASAQRKPYETFDWRPSQPRKPTSLRPYGKDDTTTTSYDSRYYKTYPSSDPFHEDSSGPYSSDVGPYSSVEGSYESDAGPYNSETGPYPQDPYPADYPKSQPYAYPGDSGSYEHYGAYPKEEMDIDVERYGGFGGTGDTRGFGAYDFPKPVHEVQQDLHHEQPIHETHHPDPLRSIYHRRSPTHVRPLPPPL